MSEKTEKATAYKLQKAKERGQVNKSVELNNCVFLLMMICIISALWPKILSELKALLIQLFCLGSHIQFNSGTINHLSHSILSQLISLWLPIALTAVLSTIIGSIAQTGLVWSTTAISPDFKRLNVIQGSKKLFSVKTCFDTLKTILKLTFSCLLLYVLLKTALPNLVELTFSQPPQAPDLMMSFLLKLMGKLLLLLSALALLDKLYTHWKYNKDHRMSRQEVKDEWKQKEGDPKIKNRIKQLQHQLRQKTASIKAVKTADVVITNPTHLAIALKYERGVMPAPKVVCKAQGEMVLEVKKLAKKYKIPVIENKVFARLLHQSIELNQWISKDLYPVAASIFRDIYQLGAHR